MPTVLVVEDDPVIADVLRHVLHDEGYDVVVAVDGDAPPTAAQTRPAVVLLDLNMPGMNGIEVARQLKADPTTRAIPIVLMSAASQLREQSQQAPVEAVLVKPFNLDHVVAVVEQLAGPP